MVVYRHPLSNMDADQGLPLKDDSWKAKWNRWKPKVPWILYLKPCGSSHKVTGITGICIPSAKAFHGCPIFQLDSNWWFGLVFG